MLAELRNANEKIISILKSQNGVLGSWYFGSVSHEMSDAYSDIDIVFLIDGGAFEAISGNLVKLIAPAADRVILCWGEGFNNEKIKSYDLLLLSNGQIFQYDLFFLNKKYIDDYMCRLHYADLQEKHVVFDLHGEVRKLIENAPGGALWSEDVDRLIETYWLHVQMSVKYFLRKDFFKLEGVLRTLMDTHTSLLLTGLDQIRWGGSASKLHFIEEEKQKHLMRYGCTEDFRSVRDNLLQSILWFEGDVAEVGSPENRRHSEEIGKLIKPYWMKNTEAGL